jgi:anhydro-N-acetylmuramic acid kinase
MVRAIGLMSGTSMDGVDVALIETDGETHVTLGRSGCFPYRETDRALLRRAVAEAASLNDRTARPGFLALADAMVTLRHAEAVKAFLATEPLRREDIDLYRVPRSNGPASAGTPLDCRARRWPGSCREIGDPGRL